jgi:hypothetical protein
MQKSATQLKKGDVVVSPKGKRHTVTSIYYTGTTDPLLELEFDTGLHLTKSNYEAKGDIYDVAD